MTSPAMAGQGDIYDVPITVINGSGDRQPDMITAVVVPFVFALVSIVLRFCSRWMNKTSLGLDDWLMIPALAASLVTFCVSFWGFSHGNGMYIGVVTFGKLRVILLEIFISELIYSIIIACVKGSILSLYWRIFPTRPVKIFTFVLGTITLGWLISNTVVVCLQCQPIVGFWDKTVPAQCNVDLKAFLLAAAFVNVFSDIVILALPIILCLRLQQTSVNKVLLVCVFATGFLVTIVSIVRLVAVFHMDITDPVASLNITWSFVDVSIWTEVEQNIAIVSACLPCLKPVFNKMIPARLVPSSLRKQGTTPAQGGSGSSKRTAKSGKQNMWLNVGAWRTRSREQRGLNMSELLHTENHDSDSHLAVNTFERSDGRSATLSSSTKLVAERPVESRASDWDVEQGTSSHSTRRGSWDAGSRPEQLTWKAHG